MRAMIIAAGLCLATTAASAGPEYKFAPRAESNLKLTNGCVYAAHPSGQSGTWALMYKQAGTTASCPLAVRTQAVAYVQEVSRGQAALVAFETEQRFASEPQYMVGVFR